MTVVAAFFTVPEQLCQEILTLVVESPILLGSKILQIKDNRERIADTRIDHREIECRSRRVNNGIPSNNPTIPPMKYTRSLSARVSFSPIRDDEVKEPCVSKMVRSAARHNEARAMYNGKASLAYFQSRDAGDEGC
mmetsp:Transcript_8558/g.20932  ORF Transcript_8558/g.20932 Transcript_8558/m.20932 type:complete len:136 (-) Transcript_8558:710-1117(-)